MRWESRGKNWGTNFKFQKAKAIISLIFPLWSGERLDVLGSLENAGVDWLVFRSLLKLKKVVKFSTAVLIVIRGITQMKTNNSPSPSRPTPATSSPSSTIQMHNTGWKYWKIRQHVDCSGFSIFLPCQTFAQFCRWLIKVTEAVCLGFDRTPKQAELLSFLPSRKSIYDQQVCQQWSSWDCPQLWRRLLRREEARVRTIAKDTKESSNGETEKLKTETKKLWQLRAAWKKAECETTRIEVGSWKSYNLEKSLVSFVLSCNSWLHEKAKS